MSVLRARILGVAVLFSLGAAAGLPGETVSDAEVKARFSFDSTTLDNRFGLTARQTRDVHPDLQRIGPWISSVGVDWIIFLLIVNVLLLIAGNVMEASSIVLIMAPILFPVAVKLGIHPVHLGILMVVNMEVGMCHPPVGLNLYVASGIAKMGITELTIAVWPWLLTMLGFLVVVTYVPEISLWLPRALGML